MATLEERRNMALKKADEAYYDINSPHYKNNERYSWAVNTINKGFDKDVADEKVRKKDLIMADKNEPLESTEPKALIIQHVVVSEAEFYCEQEMSLGKGNICKIRCDHCKELDEQEN